jgi:hypothetical protein
VKPVLPAGHDDVQLDVPRLAHAPDLEQGVVAEEHLRPEPVPEVVKVEHPQRGQRARVECGDEREQPGVAKGVFAQEESSKQGEGAVDARDGKRCHARVADAVPREDEHLQVGEGAARSGLSWPGARLEP